MGSASATGGRNPLQRMRVHLAGHERAGRSNAVPAARMRGTCASGFGELYEVAILVALPNDAFRTGELFGSRACLGPRIGAFKQMCGAAASMRSHPVD